MNDRAITNKENRKPNENDTSVLTDTLQIISTAGWNDYELLDSGDGSRLERFGRYVLSRPDPQILWKRAQPDIIWASADAVFERTSTDNGRWIRYNPQLPDIWNMRYKNLTFKVKLTPFKHTGVFPEQCTQWDFIQEIIYQRTKIINQAPHILNLFAYTGIATLAAATAGAKVTHVDASRPAIGWAKENQHMSALSEKPIRWILDDAMKFIQREVKRGVRYDGIILDPPVFGHGPDGKVWKFSEHFPLLLDLCTQVLSKTPLFVLVNAYAISSSAFMLQNVFQDYLHAGKIVVGELALVEKRSPRLLSTGIFAKWTF